MLSLVALTFPSPGGAEELTTKDISFGEHWSGPKVDRARDLEGKVVLLKIWGG